MELRVLRYFLAVAREQSVSAAAAALHISQPALSTQIKAMEQALGKQLFIRGTKGARKVALTEEGRLLRRRAEEILFLVKRTEEEIAGSDAVLAGDVYIGAGETDMVRLFAEAAKQLQAAHPDVCVHISSGNTAYVLDALDRGLIDFGLLFNEVDGRKYASIPVPFRDTWGVLMRRDAALADRAGVCPEDLWDKPLIVSQQPEDARRISQWLDRELDSLHVVATYNLLFNASLLVEEGLGYALCLDKIMQTRGSGLCFRPLRPALEAAASIVWKRQSSFSRAARAFLACLRSQLQPV